MPTTIHTHRPKDLTLHNWTDAPYNRWGFWHVRQMARMARIARGTGPVLVLPRAEKSLDDFSIKYAGEQVAWPDYLERSFTDAMVVIHNGALVYEWYADGFGPTDPHLLMSCSKSLTATYFGKLVCDGLIDTARMVPDYVARLRGTAWEGCTVQMVLDMRSGTRFDETNYDDPLSDGRLIEEVSGYRPRVKIGLPADTQAWIAGVENASAHGGPFVYRSLLTDVLGWIIQEVTGKPFAQAFSDDLWSQIGAEHDAEVIVDDSGFAAVEGGICTTARDFARFGLMCYQNGEIGGKQVVNARWFARLRERDQGLIDAFAGQGVDPAVPDACYHDQWWVSDPVRGIYSAYGINGQQLLIHPPTHTVIAKFSSWPTAISALNLQDAGLYALCKRLRS